MAQSMTGYGRGSGEANGVVLQAELRSVNHRYLDVRPHMPPALQALESKAATLIQRRLSRGRVDVTVRPEHGSRSLTAVRPDLDNARQYIEALKQLGDAFHLSGAVDVLGLAGFKDVIVSEDAGELAAEAEEALCIAVEAALDQLQSMRDQEGERLTKDLVARLLTLERYAAEVSSLLPKTVDAARERLETRVRELLQRAGGEAPDIDEARILTEVTLIAERSDATEEMVRLGSHVTAMRSLLGEKGAVGRKADFLCQELLREINTLGSKVSDVEVTRLVVDMKTELERVREQVQNLE